jgi:hypothetical protein
MKRVLSGCQAVGILALSLTCAQFALAQGESSNVKECSNATLSANGNIVAVTIEGTHTVDPDCTGTMTLNVSPLGATVHLDFLISADGSGLRAIVVDSGVVESRSYSK